MPPVRAVEQEAFDDPATLLAIARAAHLTGNRDLERAARRALRDQHNIEVTFRRPKVQEVANVG